MKYWKLPLLLIIADYGLFILGFDLSSDEQMLSSFDLAPWSKVSASSTCGETEPERFCHLTDLGFELGHYCDTCDASHFNSSHPASNVIDGTNSWWKSTNGQHKVSITFDFEKEFFVSFVALMMGPSPKPADWILERSTDFGKTYRPWQFFAERPHDCKKLYGIPANLVPRTPDQVICQSDTFKILKNEEVFVMLIKGRTGPVNFSSSLLLQNWTRATNVRLRFFRLQTLGGEKIHNDDSATRRHFYSVRSIVIGGRCMCSGHDSGCLYDTTKKEIRCQCADNTCGLTCSDCCPAFRQHPWTANGACKACNCLGHSEECVYNQTVAKLGLSLDSDEKYLGGGVCLGCRHNTDGINCQECQPKYYRVSGIDLNDTAVCQECDCDSLGSMSDQCHPNGGQCPCRWLVGGRRCDRCVSSSVWDFPHCKPCNCFEAGSMSEDCDSKNGQCRCRLGMTGLKCDICTLKETQILTLGGCLNCNRCGVGLIEKTASTLLPLISVLSNFTSELKNDLDLYTNFVIRRLEWLRESTMVAKNVQKGLPLHSLKTIENSQIVSELEASMISLFSRWTDLRMTSKYMLPLASAVSLSADHILGRSEDLFNKMKAIEFGMRNRVDMLASLRTVCEKDRCLQAGNPDKLHLPIARWSNIKNKSQKELEKVKRLHAFVVRYLWATRRIRVAVEKFQEIFVESSERTVKAKTLVIHLKSAQLKGVKAKMLDSKRQYHLLPVLDKNSVSTLRSNLRDSYNVIVDSYKKLSMLNRESFKDWSRESFVELEDFCIDVMWPHVLGLEEAEQLILKIFRRLESNMFVRKQVLDNLVAISQLVADANHTVSFLSSIDWLSKEDYGVTDGSGVAYDDEDYSRDVMYEEQLVRIERISNRGVLGLEVKHEARHVADKVKAIRGAHEEKRKQLKLISIGVDRVAKDLINLSAYRNELDSRLKLASADDFREDVSSVAESSLRMQTSMRTKYGSVDLQIKSSLVKFANANWTVSNVTFKLDRMFHLVNNMKRFLSETSRFNYTFARVRTAVKRFHQLSGWFNTPVTLTAGHLKIPLVEDTFLAPYTLTTRVEMSFRPIESNSFLLLLGNPLRKDVSECYALVYMNASRVKVIVGQGNHTLELENPLRLTHGHWYHLNINWIQDIVNVSLSPLGNEKFLSTVGSQLVMETPTVRRFSPGIVWLGGYSEPLPDKLKISEFRGSLGSFRLNGRPLGLISKSSVSFTHPTTTKNLDTLSFDGFDFLCIDVSPHSPLFIDFHLRTLQRDAVVLLVQFQSELWFAVTLRDGELFVELSKSNAGKVFSKRNLLAAGFYCNDGRQHSVQIKLLNTPRATLYLSMDTLYRNSMKLWNVGLLSWSALYIGGVPNSIRDDDAFAALCPAANFQGCLMQLRVANRSLVSTSPLSTSMVTCPHDLSSCICSSEQTIQLKPLRFVIHTMAVSFALSTQFPRSRTLIHYSTSPYTGLKIEIGRKESNWIEVSFWSKGGDGVRRHSGGGRRLMMDTTWHLVTLSTNSTSSILTVDEDVWEDPHVGLIQQRFFTSQHLLFLGPDTGISEGSVCYRDLLLNERPLDLSPYVVSSGATVCSVTL